MTRSWKRNKALFNLWELIGITLLLVFFLRMWVIYPYPVMSSSMDPSLSKGEWVLVLRLHAFSRAPSNGDIVFFESQSSFEKSIKRVYASPGERVSKLFDGKPMDIQLKDNHFFLLGDNLNESLDSRHYGPIHLNQISGKVLWVVWPLSSLRWAGEHA